MPHTHTHTHSVLRFTELGYSGAPRPLRRRGRHAWGLPSLRPHEAKQVKDVTQLIFTYMGITEAVCRAGGARLLEAPADPGRDPCPSHLATLGLASPPRRPEAASESCVFLNFFQSIFYFRMVFPNNGFSILSAAVVDVTPYCDGISDQAEMAFLTKPRTKSKGAAGIYRLLRNHVAAFEVVGK